MHILCDILPFRCQGIYEVNAAASKMMKMPGTDPITKRRFLNGGTPNKDVSKKVPVYSAMLIDDTCEAFLSSLMINVGHIIK